MRYQALFSEKDNSLKKEKTKVSSAAISLGSVRIKNGTKVKSFGT